jgi:hypothetical protein
MFVRCFVVYLVTHPIQLLALALSPKFATLGQCLSTNGRADLQQLSLLVTIYRRTLDKKLVGYARKLEASMTGFKSNTSHQQFHFFEVRRRGMAFKKPPSGRHFGRGIAVQARVTRSNGVAEEQHQAGVEPWAPAAIHGRGGVSIHGQKTVSRQYAQTIHGRGGVGVHGKTPITQHQQMGVNFHEIGMWANLIDIIGQPSSLRVLLKGHTDGCRQCDPDSYTMTVRAAIESALQFHLQPAFNSNRWLNADVVHANEEALTARIAGVVPECLECLFLGNCWSPPVHKFFSPGFRAVARMLLLSSGVIVSKDGRRVIRLHSRIWIHVFSFAAHERECLL